MSYLLHSRGCCCEQGCLVVVRDSRGTERGCGEGRCARSRKCSSHEGFSTQNPHRQGWIGRDLKYLPVPWAGTPCSRPGCSKPHLTWPQAGMENFIPLFSACRSSFEVKRVQEERGELCRRICSVQLGEDTRPQNTSWPSD